MYVYFINTKRAHWFPLDLDFQTTDILHFSPHHVTSVYFVMHILCLILQIQLHFAALSVDVLYLVGAVYIMTGINYDPDKHDLLS